MTHWIHPDAEAELGDAAVYDATNATTAIATAFLAEYERVRDLIVENQQRGPHLDGGLRVGWGLAFCPLLRITMLHGDAACQATLQRPFRAPSGAVSIVAA